MQGTPINLALEALMLFLHCLPIGSKFNVVSFGSSFDKLFPQSVIFNEENLKFALAKISTFRSDMGRKDVLEAFKDIFKEKTDKNLPRTIYLLTVGAISNTKEVVDLIRANNNNCTVNTFGIGSSVDENLIKDCAKAGKGNFTFIHNLE
jgi:hypothetical protein